MKTLLLLSFFAALPSFLCAQSPAVDKEKLIEFYQTQRYAEAAQYLQTVYDSNTTDVRALGQMAYCYLMSGNLLAAEAQYQKIDSIQPNTSSVLFSLANINSRRGNRLKTRTYLEKIITIDSNNFTALKQLANFTDSIDLRTSYLQRASRLNATDAEVALDLAQIFVEQNRYPAAYQTLKTAIVADTGNFILQKAQMPIAIELKKYAEAVTIGERLLANGAPADVIKNLGKAYFFLKDYQKTLKWFKKLEDLSMQNELTLYYMSLSYRELKNYTMAAAYAKKTIEECISPNVSIYYGLLAGIYENNQQLSLSATMRLNFVTNIVKFTLPLLTKEMEKCRYV